jgi:hypothetical protein
MRRLSQPATNTVTADQEPSPYLRIILPLPRESSSPQNPIPTSPPRGPAHPREARSDDRAPLTSSATSCTESTHAWPAIRSGFCGSRLPGPTTWTASTTSSSPRPPQRHPSVTERGSSAGGSRANTWRPRRSSSNSDASEPQPRGCWTGALTWRPSMILEIRFLARRTVRHLARRLARPGVWMGLGVASCMLHPTLVSPWPGWPSG